MMREVCQPSAARNCLICQCFGWQPRRAPSARRHGPRADSRAAVRGDLLRPRSRAPCRQRHGVAETTRSPIPHMDDVHAQPAFLKCPIDPLARSKGAPAWAKAVLSNIRRPVPVLWARPQVQGGHLADDALHVINAPVPIVGESGTGKELVALPCTTWTRVVTSLSSPSIAAHFLMRSSKVSYTTCARRLHRC